MYFAKVSRNVSYIPGISRTARWPVGSYSCSNSDGSVTTLTIANATPDQQSIAILAGAVADSRCP